MPWPRRCSSSASAVLKPTARSTAKRKGLATRYPVSAFGFLFGMLAMLGIPPTIGFIGRWRLYETAVQIGWPLAAVFILSSILALIAYVLALTARLVGTAEHRKPASAVRRGIRRA